MDYSKYHFNYFDVIKRHERIINRPKDWEIKVLAIIMLMVTFIYTFTTFGFCSEVEEVDFNVVNGLGLSTARNYFYTSSTGSVAYFNAEKGYIYHITNNTQGSNINIAYSDEIPQVNVTYTILTTIAPSSTYDLISNGEYIYIDVNSNDTGSILSVTKEKIDDYSGAVNGLVENVGVNQMWGVFENGIDFVGVVVLVAFGLFLVVLAIKKVSKGKSEF